MGSLPACVGALSCSSSAFLLLLLCLLPLQPLPIYSGYLDISSTSQKKRSLSPRASCGNRGHRRHRSVRCLPASLSASRIGSFPPVDHFSKCAGAVRNLPDLPRLYRTLLIPKLHFFLMYTSLCFYHYTSIWFQHAVSASSSCHFIRAT